MGIEERRQNFKPCVFVVDHENVIASTVELILRNQGFDAHSFTDPIAALRAAKSRSPDILVTDALMPRMNGIDLAIQIQQGSPSCKILLLSRSVSVTGPFVKVEVGRDFVLVVKPVHPANLIKAIREALQNENNLRRSSPISPFPTLVSSYNNTHD